MQAVVASGHHGSILSMSGPGQNRFEQGALSVQLCEGGNWSRDGLLRNPHGTVVAGVGEQ